LHVIFLKICNFTHGAGRSFIALRVGVWKDDGGIFEDCALFNQGVEECGRRDAREVLCGVVVSGSQNEEEEDRG
jgi:hypothetical protein